MRILFVDDEASILDGIRRILRPKRDVWDMEFTDSGAAALARIDDKPIQAIVTDMRMPGMNGAQLLREVKARDPNTVRIVLSGYADEGLLGGTMGYAHRFLTKPCPGEVLSKAVDRSLALRRHLESEPSANALARLSPLPPLPEIYTDLTAALETDHTFTGALNDTLVNSPEAASQLMEIVNTLCFSSRPTITKPSQIASTVGTDTIRTLTLGIGLFAQFQTALAATGSSLTPLVEHSFRVAVAAKRIALETGCSLPIQEQAFMAGLLHDIGHFLFATRLPEEYARVRVNTLANNRDISVAERHVTGATHGDIGGQLLLSWGMPDMVTEAVTFHHDPMAAGKPEHGPLAAVHIANVLDSNLSNPEADIFGWEFDWRLIDALQLRQAIEGWRIATASPVPSSAVPSDAAPGTAGTGESSES